MRRREHPLPIDERPSTNGIAHPVQEQRRLPRVLMFVHKVTADDAEQGRAALEQPTL